MLGLDPPIPITLGKGLCNPEEGGLNVDRGRGFNVHPGRLRAPKWSILRFKASAGPGVFCVFPRRGFYVHPGRDFNAHPGRLHPRRCVGLLNLRSFSADRTSFRHPAAGL